MDDLLQVMQIVDSHSNVLPEGDYLEICKHLKNAYNKRADPVYFFDHDSVLIFPPEAPYLILVEVNGV